jgi:hypothetical protein
LSADLTRWADATARLFTELAPDEHVAHLEKLWVREEQT